MAIGDFLNQALNIQGDINVLLERASGINTGNREQAREQVETDALSKLLNPEESPPLPVEGGGDPFDEFMPGRGVTSTGRWFRGPSEELADLSNMGPIFTPDPETQRIQELINRARLTAGPSVIPPVGLDPPIRPLRSRLGSDDQVRTDKMVRAIEDEYGGLTDVEKIVWVDDLYENIRTRFGSKDPVDGVPAEYNELLRIKDRLTSLANNDPDRDVSSALQHNINVYLTGEEGNTLETLPAEPTLSDLRSLTYEGRRGVGLSKLDTDPKYSTSNPGTRSLYNEWLNQLSDQYGLTLPLDTRTGKQMPWEVYFDRVLNPDDRVHYIWNQPEWRRALIDLQKSGPSLVELQKGKVEGEEAVETGIAVNPMYEANVRSPSDVARWIAAYELPNMPQQYKAAAVDPRNKYSIERAIQNWIYANQDQLAEAGVVLPSLGNYDQNAQTMLQRQLGKIVLDTWIDSEFKWFGNLGFGSGKLGPDKMVATPMAKKPTEEAPPPPPTVLQQNLPMTPEELQQQGTGMQDEFLRRVASDRASDQVEEQTKNTSPTLFPGYGRYN